MEPQYIISNAKESALIIAAGALLASVVGGLVAGYFSNRSVRKTLEGQGKRNKEHQQQVILGVLEAIHQELYVIFNKLYAQSIEDIWKKFDDKEKRYFDAYMSVPEDYLTIFRSNANIIGQINNSDLRYKIVNTYMHLQVLLDRYKMNNKLLDQSLEIQYRDPSFHASLISQLEILAPTLRQEHNTLRGLVDDFFEAVIKEWPLFGISNPAEEKGRLDSGGPSGFRKPSCS